MSTVMAYWLLFAPPFLLMIWGGAPLWAYGLAWLILYGLNHTSNERYGK